MARTLVLRVDGTNCDQETVRAFWLAGSEVHLAHMNEVLKKEVRLEDYHILAIPGGFSYGDDIAAGKIFANELRFLLGDEVRTFIEHGKLVLGICNGFQVLVKAGLLPALHETVGKQEATLNINDSGLFIDKWITLKPELNTKCIFTSGVREMQVPINHGEGKFIAPHSVLNKLEENGQIALKYVDNPNGSMRDIAGICNRHGTVFGLMPHPEKHVHPYQHPQWTRKSFLPKQGDGLLIFQNAVEYAKRCLA